MSTSVEKARMTEHEYQDNLTARQVLKRAVEKFHPDLKLASSFGAESLVILDKLSKIIDRPKVFMLDTGRLPQETHELVERVQDEYQVDLEIYFPDTGQLEGFVSENGVNPFYDSVELRKKCCEIRKVEPMNRALDDAEAWISGMRRSQGPTRSNIQTIEKDESHGSMLKFNPLADWNKEQVWGYIRYHDVPYNNLYDEGYKSIGCDPCTRPVQSDQPERAGRWWWENPETKECGIHQNAQ